MKIYIGHSRGFNFKKELYEPIIESGLCEKHEIRFPHKDGDEPFSSKEFLKTCDLMIAEVSYPATGLGMELAYAHDLNVPIVCIYKKGAKISGSLKTMTDRFVEYGDDEEMVERVREILKKNYEK